MRVLITGATGFIGKSVLDKISSKEFEILAIGNKNKSNHKTQQNLHWIFGEIGKIEEVKELIMNFNPDVVIHLAWEGIPDYAERMSKKNLADSITFFDFIIEETNCKKILSTGSCWEYGKTIGECNETDPIIISSYFTWAKHSLYEYLKLRCLQKSIILNWFRLFYIYGKGQREAALIPTIIRSIKEGVVPNIKTPFTKNDFVFINDIAELLEIAINKDTSSGIYNVGSGKTYSVVDIYKNIEIKMKNSNKDILNPFNSVITTNEINFWANTEKTSSVFNWSAHTSLEKLTIHELI